MLGFIDSDLMSSKDTEFEEFISSLNPYTVNASNVNQRELQDIVTRLNEYMEEVNARLQEGLRQLEEPPAEGGL